MKPLSDEEDATDEELVKDAISEGNLLDKIKLLNHFVGCRVAHTLKDKQHWRIVDTQDVMSSY